MFEVPAGYGINGILINFDQVDFGVDELQTLDQVVRDVELGRDFFHADFVI